MAIRMQPEDLIPELRSMGVKVEPETRIIVVPLNSGSEQSLAATSLTIMGVLVALIIFGIIIVYVMTNGKEKEKSDIL